MRSPLSAVLPAATTGALTPDREALVVRAQKNLHGDSSKTVC
jgi:hypothetical protein